MIPIRENFHVERHVLRKRVLDWPTTGRICIPRCPPVIRRRPRKLTGRLLVCDVVHALRTRACPQNVLDPFSQIPPGYTHLGTRACGWSLEAGCLAVVHTRGHKAATTIFSVIVDPHLLYVRIRCLSIGVTNALQHFLILSLCIPVSVSETRNASTMQFDNVICSIVMETRENQTIFFRLI